MKLFIILLMLQSGLALAQNKTGSCDFIWHTFSEDKSFLKRPVDGSLTEIITSDLFAIIKLEDKKSSVKIKEMFKEDKKNSIEYEFTCDTNLICKGIQHKTYNGKKDSVILDTATSNKTAFGRLGSRDIFLYTNEKQGFSYHYILYRDETDSPMGLKIKCQY